MDATPSNFHESGHRILVSFAKGDDGSLMYLRYGCEDPTCDWCVVEYGPGECKDLVRITDSLLTHDFYYDKSQEGGRDARNAKVRCDQPTLFPEL